MKKIVVCVAIFSAWWTACSVATAPAPSSQEDCNNQLTELIPCLAFVQGLNKTVSTACCTGFLLVVNTRPACLCNLLLSGAAGSADVNLTLAMELPSKCQSHASLSSCSVSSGGAPVPVAGGGSSSPNPPNSALISAPTVGMSFTAAAVCLLFLINKIN